MRKLTSRRKAWLLHRAKQQLKRRTFRRIYRPIRTRRFLVAAWNGEEIEKVICLNPPQTPPKQICFDANPEACIRFFEASREKSVERLNSPNTRGSSWFINPRKSNRLRRIKSFVDYSKIEHISTSAAVVLTAEYERLRELIGEAPPAINLNDWNPAVFKKLFEIGFFQSVGLSEEFADEFMETSSVKSTRVISGKDTSDLESASAAIMELCEFLGESASLEREEEIALNSAISEAMSNVSKHAYPEEHRFQCKHVGRWWLAASADRSARSLTVVLYDQGATIPVTFQWRSWPSAVVNFMKRNVSSHTQHDYMDDSVYIAGAMLLGKTQTGEAHRGRGLPEMQELTEVTKGGHLTILSRGGQYTYSPEAGAQHRSFPASIGGTLIEWKIDLDARGRHDG